MRAVPALRLVDAPDPRDADDWMTRGECNGADQNVFFPERGGDHETAKAICRTCPVINECRTYALVNVEMFGIWGGLSGNERKRIRRNAAQAPKGAAVLAFMDDGRTVTSHDVSAFLACPVDAAAAILHRLFVAGAVLRVGRQNRRWLYQISGGGPSS